MSTGTTNAYDLAVALQSAIIDAFATVNVVLPTRQYLTFGTAVGECDSFIVSFSSIYNGVPGQSPTVAPLRNAQIVRVATYEISIFRCLSGILSGEGQQLDAAPSVVNLNNDAKTVMTDAFTLHRGIALAKSKGTFIDYCEAMSLGEALAINPQGSIGGVAMSVTAELS